MIPRAIPFIVLAAALFPGRAAAFDQPFLTFGTHGKASAGETVVGQRGALATLYNPANLSSRAHHGLYSELSVLSLAYSYEYPGEEPAQLSTVLPVPMLGYSTRLTKRLSWGLAGIGAPGGGAGEQEVEGLPLRLVGSDAALVDIRQSGGDGVSYLLGTGLSYRLPSRLSLGAGVIRSETHTRLEVDDHETSTHLFTIDTRVTATRFLLGGRWTPARYFDLGLAYEPAHSPEFYTKSLAEDGGERTLKGRRGDKLRLGGEGGTRRYRLFLELQREGHREDEGNALDLGLTESEPDQVDTINGIFGGRLNLANANRLTLGYGWFPSPLGNGVMAEESSDGVEYAGMSFARFDGISRNVYGGGWTGRLGGGRLGTAVSHHRGQRDVPDTSRGYGTHRLEVYHLAVDYAHRF